MKKKVWKALLSTVLAAGIISSSCFAAGSQTKVVEVVKDSSSGKVDGVEIKIEIVADNTDMKSVNELKVVSVPEELKPAYNVVITETKVPEKKYSEVVKQIVEKEEIEVKVIYKEVDEETGELVIKEAEEYEYDLEKASALTAPFELYPEKDDTTVLEKVEDAKTTLKILELEALAEMNSDNEELLESIRIACWVYDEEGNLVLQIIKPVEIDLENGHLVVEFGDLVPCMAQIIYDADLVIPPEE